MERENFFPSNKFFHEYDYKEKIKGIKQIVMLFRVHILSSNKRWE